MKGSLGESSWILAGSVSWLRPETWGRDWWILATVAWIPVNALPSLVTAVVGLVLTLGRERLHLQDPLARGLIGLAVLTGLVSVGATDRSMSWLGSFNYWPFYLCGMAVSLCLTSATQLRRLATVILASSAVISSLGLAQVIWGWQGRIQMSFITLGLTLTDRPAAIFASPNVLAIYLTVVMAIAVGMILASGSCRVAWVALGLATPLLVLTASRNGWGVAWLMVILFLIYQRQWQGLSGWLGLSFLPVGAALGVPGLRWIVPSMIWQRLADTVDPQAAFFSSTSNRLDAWQFALNMVQQRPWWGWGWQSFAALYNTQDPSPSEHLSHCHHLYLTLAAEGGLIVLLGSVGVWGWILWRGWQARQGRDEALVVGILIGLTGYFVSGLLDAVYFDARINVLIWILLGSLNGIWLGKGPDPEASSSEFVNLS